MLNEVPDVKSSGSRTLRCRKKCRRGNCPGLNVSKNECVVAENYQCLNVLNVEVARV